MANESLNSDLVDPLAAYSTLSLLPRTCRASTGGPTKPDNQDDMNSLHTYLNSMALRSPLSLVEQAKTIVDNDLGLLKSKFPSHAEDKNEAVTANDNENPLQRRPALRDKRAHFSFKPHSVHPDSLLPTLDISKLQDPVEYFLAHEKLENAKKEIERQTGTVLTGLEQHKTSRSARQRRPGILGYQRSRGPAVYRHHYPSMGTIIGNISSSQERFGPDVLSPSNSKFQQEEADQKLPSQENISADSVTNAEQKVCELLDELLSANLEDIEGDDALTLLQQRLQIKPLEIDKIRLPEFQRNDFRVLGGNLPKRRSALAGIQNVLTGMSNKTPVKRKHLGETPVRTSVSATPPKSPLAYISSLKKRILSSSLSNDPFVELNFDPSPARISSPIEDNHDEFDRVDTRESSKDSGKLKPLMVDEGGTDTATVTGRALTESSTSPFVKSVDKTVSIKSIASVNALNVDPSPTRNSYPVEGNHDHVNTSERLDDSGKLLLIDEVDGITASKMDSRQALSKDSTLPFEKLMDQNLGKPDNYVLSSQSIDFPEDGTGDGNMEDMVIDNGFINHITGFGAHTNERARSSKNEHARLGENEPLSGLGNSAEIVQEQSASPARADFSIKDSTAGGPSNSFSPHGQSKLAAVEPNPINSQQEQHIKEPSAKASNEKKKSKAPPRKAPKRKELSRRQSLAGAGTSWESGVRRSTRIRFRPLEYWKGERFLYGRVHNSLTSVIGIKYVSPGKEGREPAFRVKSYVSDKYKELVDLAALH